MPFVPGRHVGKPEEVAVIGGGVEGCLAALMLARTKTSDGQPQYHVTLIEAQDKILNGASSLAARLHLGGEYPLDPRTGEDCVKGAVIWKLVMPDGIYTDRKPMKFTVSKESEKEGRLTVQKYLDYYEGIRRIYQNLFAQAKEAFSWDDREAAKKLFGSPEPGKFFRRLTAKEINPYPTVAGGFQSQEPGLNVPLYTKFLHDAVMQEKKNGNISVITGYKVKDIRKQKDGSYLVNVPSQNYAFSASQVIQAAWEKGPEITPLKRGKEIMAYNRAMLMFELPKVMPPEARDPIFIMLGENGGMLSPYNLSETNNQVALGYIPGLKTAYRAEKLLIRGDSALPPDWNEDQQGINTAARVSWMHEYLDRLKKLFPFLEGARPMEIVVRPTLNFQKGTEQRRHEPTQEVKPGLFTMYATKVTLAPQSAIEAVEMVKMRSSVGKIVPIAKPDALKAALAGQYSIADAAKLTPSDIREFTLDRRAMDSGMVPSGKFARQFSAMELPPAGEEHVLNAGQRADYSRLLKAHRENKKNNPER